MALIVKEIEMGRVEANADCDVNVRSEISSFFDLDLSGSCGDGQIGDIVCGFDPLNQPLDVVASDAAIFGPDAQSDFAVQARRTGELDTLAR